MLASTQASACLGGLPEYPGLSHIIETYPETMGDDMKLINEYSEALQRFDDKGFYQIEEKSSANLNNFRLPDLAHRQFSTPLGWPKAFDRDRQNYAL